MGRARRRPRRARPAGPVRADRPALAARRRPHRPGGGQPLDRWLCRAVRSGRRARSRSPTTPRTSWSSTRPPHAWFNGGLLADRWANEAFASYYGLEAAAELEVKATGDELTPELEAARIPLNAWGAGRARGRRRPRTTPTPRRSPWPRAIAERAGADGLRAVWADAAARVGAYQPVATGEGTTAAVGGGTEPETVDGPPDWRGLLDLLEATDRTDLRRPVADLGRARHRPGRCSTRAGDARTAVRRRCVAAAGDWRLPRAGPRRDARLAVRPGARRCSTTPRRSSSSGRRSRPAAAAAGLTAPDTLRTAFESPDGFATRHAEATAELEAIDALRRRGRGAARRRPIRSQVIGLWGTTPEARPRPGTDALRGRRPRRSAARPTRPSPPGPARRGGQAAEEHRSWRSPAARSRHRRFWPRGAAPWPARSRPASSPVRTRAGMTTTPRAYEDRFAAPRATSPAGPVRYTRRHSGPGRTGRGRGRGRERSGTGLMGLTRSRPSHEILSGDSADVYFARAETHPRQGGPRPARDDGGLHPPGRRPVRHRRGAQPARPRPRRRPTRRDAGSRRSRTATRSRRRRSCSGSAPATASSGCTRRRSSGCSPSRPAGRPPPAPCVEAAAPEPVISFGARHIHPDITDVLDYAAIVGGCVGASTPAGARLAGLAPTGTMPHSLVLIFGDTVEAALAFDRHVAPDVPRIVLVDTFKDEAEEALRVAHALGDRLYGVRLDTPSERGRVTADLVHEVRARLDQAGFDHVKITVSGGLNPERIALLQGGRRAGRLVRGRLVHQRRDADRLHRRHQGDRRPADRQARPHPRAHRLAAPRAGRPGGVPRGVGRSAGGALAPSVPPSAAWSPGRPDEAHDDEERETAYDLLQRGQALLDRRHLRAGRDRARAGRPPRAGKGSILEALGRAYFNSGQAERARGDLRGAARRRSVVALRPLRARPEPEAARPAPTRPGRTCASRSRSARRTTPRISGRRSNDVVPRRTIEPP